MRGAASRLPAAVYFGREVYRLRRYMWQHWINFLAGIWLVISPYVGFSSDDMRTNLIISGLIVAVVAIWGALASGQRMSEMTR